MAEEGWTRLDRFIASGDNSHLNEQSVQCTDKGKCSAFGEAIVGSGRAEWDLQIDFESFGGICIGVYRQNLRDRDNINALPCDQAFAWTPDGYGYANKTGAFTSNSLRKKYGVRYRHGDKLTVRLDLTARDLTFLVNDESQGVAYEGLPKGAYRIAVKIQFKEQKVAILRFWTSLGKDDGIPNVESTITQTSDKDKKAKPHTPNPGDDDYDDYNLKKTTSQKAVDLYKDYKEPELDPDADWFGNYNSGGGNNNNVKDNNEEDEEEDIDYDDDDTDNKPPPDLETKGSVDTFDEEEKEKLLEIEKMKPKRRSASLEEVQNDVQEQDRKVLSDQLDKLQNMTESELDDDDEKEHAPHLMKKGMGSSSLNTDDVGLIGGRSRGLSKQEQKAPEPLNISQKDDDASSDFFSICGSNLTTDQNTVTCTRQSTNGAHSAFGAQLVSRGKIEWMVQIEKGHSVRIGICGQTQSTDRVFTETKYGYGYGDDGNIYFGGSHIEYNDGYKQGDIVGVYLDMDTNTLKFSVNGIDHGNAFDSISLNENDNVTGYRLGVSLQHRPHKIKLLESTLYNTQRLSPRPDANQYVGHGNASHQRKLSWAAMDASKKKHASKTSNTPSITDVENEIDEFKDDKSSYDKIKTDEPKKKKKKGVKSPKSSTTKDKKKGGKKGKKKKGTDDKDYKKGGKKKNGAKGGKKKKNENKKTVSSKKKKNKDDEEEKKEDAKASKNKKKVTKKSKDSKTKKSIKEKKAVNWVKKDKSKDGWEQSGPKLSIEKSIVSSKTDIKDGNSAFGKLIIKNKMRAKWDVLIKQGDNIGIGVINLIGGFKSTKNRKLLTQFFTNDINGYGYMGNDGGIQRSGRYKKYGIKFKAGDKVTIKLDMSSKSLSFSVNGEDQGVAFKNLPQGEYRLAVTFAKKWHKVALSKTVIWTVAK